MASTAKAIWSGEGHVRMALVLPPDQIALAVEAIREAGLY